MRVAAPHAPVRPDCARLAPMSKPPPVKPAHIALACILAVAAMFVGSIVIGVAVVQADRAMHTAQSGNS